MSRVKTAVTVNYARRVYTVRKDRVLREYPMSQRAAPHVAAILRKRGIKVEEVGQPIIPEKSARERAIERLLGIPEPLAQAS